MKRTNRAILITTIHALFLGGAQYLRAEEVKAPLKADRFCANGEEAGRTAPASSLENKERKSLTEVLHLSSTSVRIEKKSQDWKSETAALHRVHEVLKSRPGTLNSMSLWAEGVDTNRQSVRAFLGEDGSTIEISNFHVCVRDAKGHFWFFRTVPVDGWRK